MVTLVESAKKWDSYLSYGTRQSYKGKTFIYKQGTIGDGFYYLHKGLVKIVSSTAKGNERILNIVVPGQLLGVQAMDQKPHFTTAITVKDCVLYYFSCEQFKELILSKTDFLHLFSQTVIQKMRILSDGINLNALPPEQQVATVLFNICHEFNNYEVPLTQQDLANCTGLTRITVYKILKQWKENDLIDIQKRKFIIKRPDWLQQFSMDGKGVC